MNWYNGNIADAIKLTKLKNAIFVVYVEGKDEASKKITSFINDSRIRSKLETENFVAIRIEGGSESYMQFASIYQIVPLPSLFFIGRNGTPLEIGTCAIESIDDLEKLVDRAIKNFAVPVPFPVASGTTSPESSKSTVTVDVLQIPSEPDPKESSPIPNSSRDCETATTNDILTHPENVISKPKGESKTTNNEVTSLEKEKTHEIGLRTANSSSLTAAELSARVEETRKILEQKRRERVEEERRLEKEREISRRKGGKDMMNAQQWQKEQELAELKNNIRRERREEQEARQRILEKIASDRAERAQKYGTDTQTKPIVGQTTQENVFSTNTKSLNNYGTSRLHFRVSNGNSKTHTFNSTDTFDVVRNFVQTNLLPGTGIKDFTLATTYPKREFAAVDDSKTVEEHGLCPSAVILVISKQISGPAAVVARSGGIVNILNVVFWTLVSPVMAFFGYLKNTIGGGGNAGETGAQKRANEGRINPNDLRKKPNLDHMRGTPSTSKGLGPSRNGEQPSETYRRFVTGGTSNIHRLTDNHDTDDENATWNGNSTQQQ